MRLSGLGVIGADQPANVIDDPDALAALFAAAAMDEQDRLAAGEGGIASMLGTDTSQTEVMRLPGSVIVASSPTKAGITGGISWWWIAAAIAGTAILMAANKQRKRRAS